MRCGVHQINARITTAVADSRKHVQILPLSVYHALLPALGVGRADCSDGQANQKLCYGRSYQTGLSACCQGRSSISCLAS